MVTLATMLAVPSTRGHNLNRTIDGLICQLDGAILVEERNAPNERRQESPARITDHCVEA